MKSYFEFIALLMLIWYPDNVLYSQVNNHTHKYWTLDECIYYALDNNIELKAEKLSLEESKISISDSKWAFAPNISANTSYNLSIGRVLDETTYEFVTNQMMGSASSSVSASILLFDGLKNLRQLQYSKLNKEAAALKYKKAENDLYLNITAYFLEILCGQENIKNCKSIVELLREQEELVSIKVDHNKVTIADLLQIQSKLADAENSLLNAEHSYDLSRMNLCHILELKDYKSFVPSTNGTDSVKFYHYNYINLLEAIDYLPEVALAKKNIELSKKTIQISKAQYSPTLSLSLGYGSSFSNARQKILQNNDGSYIYKSYPFGEQYKDNASQYISLGLSIPLFTNSTINSLKRAKLELKRNKYTFYTVKKQVEKEVTQVAMDAEMAWKKLQKSKKYLLSATEAMRQIKVKFEAGSAGMMEYNDVVSSLVEAQAKYLSDKYEYIFKVKILNFYEKKFILP